MRPSWDDYFMMIANIVRTRSHDVETQHGCVIVDENHKIVSTGYNGFPSGCEDKKLPNTRPEKYPYMVHSEMNAILTAGRPLKGCTLYVTGYPCLDCFKNMIQAGIRRIVVLDMISKCIGTYEEYWKHVETVLAHTGATIDRMTSVHLKHLNLTYIK